MIDWGIRGKVNGHLVTTVTVTVLMAAIDNKRLRLQL